MNDSLKVEIGGIHVVDRVINKKTGEEKVFDRGHNLVVSNALLLITGLLKGTVSGIQ